MAMRMEGRTTFWIYGVLEKVLRYCDVCKMTGCQVCQHETTPALEAASSQPFCASICNSISS
jgi:hypothetical protein